MQQKNHVERYMGTVSVGAKGQIVIPKAVRTMFDIKPGDELLLLADTTRGIALPTPKKTAAIKDRAFDDEDIGIKEGDPT